MKKILLAITATVFTFFCYAQTEAEMKAWQAFMTPGDIHKMLSKSEGAWTADVTMWMMPGAQPIKSKATATQQMVLGGRYLQGIHKGDFMGMPFEGISMTAYDNAKKKFINSWVDNMGTGVMTLEGEWDAKKNAIIFKGTCTDPMTGKDVKVREVFTIVDDKTQTMEMWMEYEGKEFKSMEMKFTKA